ncbi:hypothetical protein [Nocardioides marmoraquaticus]
MYEDIPSEIDDRYPLTIEEFCDLTQVPLQAVRRWLHDGSGPMWAPFNGNGRLYITAGEARRFVGSPAFRSLRGSA